MNTTNKASKSTPSIPKLSKVAAVSALLTMIDSSIVQLTRYNSKENFYLCNIVGDIRDSYHEAIDAGANITPLFLGIDFIKELLNSYATDAGYQIGSSWINNCKVGDEFQYIEVEVANEIRLLILADMYYLVTTSTAKQLQALYSELAVSNAEYKARLTKEAEERYQYGR